MSVSTVDLARQAAHITPWTRDQWLEALAWIPARYDLDDAKVAAIAKYAASVRMTPRAAAATIFPEDVAT